MDSDHYFSAPSSPTSNLDPSSIPMDQLPASITMQPEIPSASAPDLASGTMARLAAVEDSLVDIQLMLRKLLLSTQNLLPAPAPAAPALVPGPEAFMADGNISQEKLVRFTMSFMSKDAAAWWAECHSPDMRWWWRDG
jgi:hypothetical protein